MNWYLTNHYVGQGGLQVLQRSEDLYNASIAPALAMPVPNVQQISVIRMVAHWASTGLAVAAMMGVSNVWPTNPYPALPTVGHVD